MQARSLIWRALPRAGLARHCTSLAVKSEAGAADALLNEALPSPSELTVADHLQSPLAQATIEALKPEGEAVPIVPLDQLEDLDGLYQSLTSPLAPQHRSRLDRHQKLREVDTDPEAFWSTTAPSVESFDHLIRACGMQEQIPRARAYFDEMEFVGLTPAASTYSALIGAHARVGDVSGARAVLDMAVQEAELEPTAPMVTGLVDAIRRAGRPAEEAHAVLGLCRRLGVTEDAPLHTSIVQAYLDQRQPDSAWKAFNEMRHVGVEADAVTFAAMLTACAMQDQLEQAHALLQDMELDDVPPTLATHNAYINVCSQRCRSLVELSANRRKRLLGLAVDISPAVPLRIAERQMQRIEEDGFSPDGYSYLGLLRACASACDVPRAQRALTRMLDAGLEPREAHFHVLLEGCTRVQVWGAEADAEEALRVARSVPSSMAALGLDVPARTLDLVLRAHTAGWFEARAEVRVDRSVELLHSLYTEHGRTAGPAAFSHMLRLADDAQHPELARQLLQQMEALQLPVSLEQLDVPYEIERKRDEQAEKRQQWLDAAPSDFRALPPGHNGRNGRPLTPRQLRKANRPAAHQARLQALAPGSG